MLIRRNNNALRAIKGTVENYYPTNFTGSGLNLGKEDKMISYANNYPTIPLSTYSSSLQIPGTILTSLIKG